MKSFRWLFAGRYDKLQGSICLTTVSVNRRHSMPDHEDSLGGETLDGGEAEADLSGLSLSDGATMSDDTAANSLGEEYTLGDANIDDDLFDDGMKLEDLSARYAEESVLGKGGFGEVMLAMDKRLNRKVAIKRIQGKAARSKTAVQRFLTEAQSIAALNHNNIVQIYDYGRSTDGPFLIMECVQGGSLFDKCKAGPIEPDEAVNIFSQICDGLAQAHAANIIHRDIKPANILMTEDGVPKLTDFGLAKDDTADTGMTMEGAVIGTLDFMPPEQHQAAELTDHRSDLWSLAATFYQMLTGKSPKVINITSLPLKLQSVVAKALEESKEERFQSALEMREAVLQAQSGTMDTSRTLGEGECPQCATSNPPDQKFCRECSAQLQVNCLDCQNEMEIWDKACGECGAQQASLVEKSLARYKKVRDMAEELLIDLQFEAAIEQSVVVGSETDSRLQQYAGWYVDFSARLESSRTSEYARLEELLHEALTHEQAYDYKSGLQTLEQVPATLKKTTVSGNKDTADELIERLSIKQTRLKELEATVRERIGKREIAGLLPIVNELLTLNPGRAEVQKLKSELEKRGVDLLEARDVAYQQATQQLEEQQYAEAVATLNTVSEEVWNEQLEDLKTTASASLKQLNYQRDRITSAVNANQLKNLLPAVEECLILQADQDDLVKLKQDLTNLESQMAARNQQIISQAQEQMLGAQFDAVKQTLDTLAQENRTSSTIKLRQKAHQLSAQRQRVLSSVSAALSNENYQVAIEEIGHYLSKIAKADIKDLQLQQMLDEAQGKVSAAIRDKKLIKLGIVAVGVAVMLITGAVIKINLDAQVVETALANLDWETALELDPDNAEGLRLQAVENNAAVVVALTKGDWRTVISLDPDNSEGLRLQAAAKKTMAEIRARAPITNMINMKLKLITAGTFMMGSPINDTVRKHYETQHKVTISKSFYIQTTEVTRGQWKVVMGTKPWGIAADGGSAGTEDANYAASHVNWFTAIEFCRRLSREEGKTYRLPTEAEWEYACRAGTNTPWSFGIDEKVLGDYAWYKENAWDIGEQYTHQVGLKKPNAFGLYDMHGNVYEWCHDYYGEDYYKSSPATDPLGPTLGSARVLRGGSWVNGSHLTRSAYRNWLNGGKGNHNAGFRLVRELD